MQTQTSPTDGLDRRQRLAMAWCVPFAAVFVLPLVDDLAHGRRTWLLDVPFFLIGLSVAMGMVAALLDPGGARITSLDVARRRTFWFGVALLPVAVYAAAFAS